MTSSSLNLILCVCDTETGWHVRVIINFHDVYKLFCSVQASDWLCCVSECAAGESWHLLGLCRAPGKQFGGSVYRTSIQCGFHN